MWDHDNGNNYGPYSRISDADKLLLHASFFVLGFFGRGCLGSWLESLKCKEAGFAYLGFLDFWFGAVFKAPGFACDVVLPVGGLLPETTERFPSILPPGRH